MNYKYIIIFFLVSLIGWIYEYILNGKPMYSLMFEIFKLPLLPIYGFFMLILIFLETHITNMNIYMKALLYTIIATIYECIFGLISKLITNKYRWNYVEKYYPACDGYISLYSSTIWYIFILIVLNLISFDWRIIIK
jgi:uncharacterized membrane protein